METQSPGAEITIAKYFGEKINAVHGEMVRAGECLPSELGKAFQYNTRLMI